MEQTIKERLTQFIKYKSLSVNKFEKVCGLSQGFVKNIGKNIGNEYVGRILQAFPELSQDWLISGDGGMIRQQTTEIDPLKDIHQNVLMVPVINLDARGGLGVPSVTDSPEYTTELVPFASGVAQLGDIVIPMYGDSMYPRYPSGSRLLIRKVECWQQYLEMGASYVIELNDGRRVVKIVKKGTDSDHFLLVSVNQEYEPQEIPVSLIANVFLVKMMLKNETV